MGINRLWYPADFDFEGGELTIEAALRQSQSMLLAGAIAARVENRERDWDIIKNQNFHTISSESLIPFQEVGTLSVPPPVPIPPPPPQPTILVSPMDPVSIDMVEGTGNGAQAIRIVITALNDDLTVYGILPDNRAYWNLEPTESLGDNLDPLLRVISPADTPVVIPQNTWKAFFVSLAPRAGTVTETEPFDTINVVFILSNAVNTYHSNVGSEKETADFFHAKLQAFPGYFDLDREHFNNYLAVRCYGRVIPNPNAGAMMPDNRFFPPAAPYPGIPPLPLPPAEVERGTAGYAIGGTDATVGQIAGADRQISRLDMQNESVFRTSSLTQPRIWGGVIGNQTQFMAAGGSSPERTTLTDSIDRYDAIERSISRIALTIRTPVDFVAGATVKNIGYLFGGDITEGVYYGDLKHGTRARIDKIDLIAQTRLTVSATLPRSRALTNCATGNAQKIWLFGGGSREVSSLDSKIYDHQPLTNLVEFNVASETARELGINLSANNCWRNASAGNRNFVYIAGGSLRASDPTRVLQQGIASVQISRFSIFDESLLLIGISLDFKTDGLAPMGGTRKIYFSGGFNNNGFAARDEIQKLDNLSGLNNETIYTIGSQLRTNKGGSAGISDYNASLS